jgi:D-alanyl-lipoteichoic acid acyltransferase DltB (MBOAT superfamily)
MLFNSPEFALFFPLAVGAYFLCPHAWRWLLLLAASYVFYMAWEPGYALLLLASTTVDYVAGRAMAALPTQAGRGKYLAASIVINLGMLFFFKYFNFFADALRPVVEMSGLAITIPHSEFLLPVGISFYTFQTMSYAIEVYRGAMPAERHFGRFALYVAFWPQLVAGPIERPQQLLPQFLERHAFVYQRVTDGLKLMAWGFFKKLVIADQLANVVNPVYADPAAHTGPVLVLATLCFTYQLYCDFSGYSDIAIGAAQVMGFRLMENFRRPFHARSIEAFWRRWHVSLSTWFRDYVYLPLGGNRGVWWVHQRNIVIVFLLSGLWHGASWTFVIWGALHAVYLLAGRATRPWRAMAAEACGLARWPTFHGAVQRMVTVALFAFSLIFFRAASLGDAVTVIQGLPLGWGSATWHAIAAAPQAYLGLTMDALLIVLTMVVLLEIVQSAQERGPLRPRLAHWPLAVRWSLYVGVVLCVLAFGVFRESQFLYFQF